MELLRGRRCMASAWRTPGPASSTTQGGEGHGKMSQRRWLIGVMGSHAEEHADLAVPLGRWLAEAGYDLLTGGGPGVMEAVSRGFAGVAGRRGVVVGVLPADKDDPARPKKGYPNPYVEVVVRTHLPAVGDDGASPASRNHVNVLSAHVVVALPGGPGTRTEVELAVRYGRPVIAYLGATGEIVGLPRERLPAVASELVE